MSVRLHDMDPGVRFGLLDGLVKDAHKNGRIAWLLSAACLRRLIFPASYRDNGKRCDDVRYSFDENDGACGKPVMLNSLSRRHVTRFLSHATLMCPTIQPEIITPIASRNP